MVDFTAIKSILLEVPGVGKPAGTVPPPSGRFSRFSLKSNQSLNKHLLDTLVTYTKKWERLVLIVTFDSVFLIVSSEMILKIIGITPLSSLVETYKTMIPECSETDFQKLMELRVSYLHSNTFF